MEMLVVTGIFCVGFDARFFQLLMNGALMVDTPAPFEPYGIAWRILSSFVYGIVCALLVLAVTRCQRQSLTTVFALTLAGGLLLADFAKPSRFENGTYLDHAIHYVSTLPPELQTQTKLSSLNRF